MRQPLLDSVYGVGLLGAVGAGRSAVGGRQWAVGSRQWAVGYICNFKEFSLQAIPLLLQESAFTA